MSNTLYRITSECICRYAVYLREQERAAHTVQKYVHDLGELAAYLDGQTVTKAALIEWKEQLTAAYAPATVNSMLTAANGFRVHGLAGFVPATAENPENHLL